MKRTELAQQLRQTYKPELRSGVVKITEPGYENIWFVVPPPPPRVLPQNLPATALAKANKVLNSLPSLNSASEIDLMASYLFLRREAVQSSRMEGTWSTIDDILTPGSLFDAKAGPSERASVLGYATALGKEIETAKKLGNKIFTIELTQRLHRQIVSKDPSFRGAAGELRKKGGNRSIVFIGGIRKENSIFNPPPPAFVRNCLKSVMHWMADEELCELGNAGMGPSLPIRLALAHAHFEAVHPFYDGNGRVGRSLLMLQIASEGKLPLYLSGYIEKEKKAYIDSLALAQKKLNYSPIIEFISEALVSTHKESEETKNCIRELPENWRLRAQFRKKSAAERALSWLITNPIFTAKQLSKEFKVSAPAAQRASAQLVEKNIVRERTGFGRNRVYAAEEVIELLTRDFGEDPKYALARAKELLKA